MKDRVSVYPGRVVLTPVAGQANTYDMVRADQPTQEGTPLMARTLLSDETAQAMGLDPANNPTPNDAFEQLAKQAVPAIVEVTLAANGWVNGIYTLTLDGVTDTSNQEILPAVGITAEQLEAMQAANIQDGGQSEGKILLKAYGDVPTIALPIRVLKRGV